MDISEDLLLFLFVYSTICIANSGTTDLDSKHKIVGYYVNVPKVLKIVLFYFPKLWTKDNKIVIHTLIYQIWFQMFTVYCLVKLLFFSTNSSDVVYFYGRTSILVLLFPIAMHFIGMFLYSRKYHVEDISEDEIDKKKDGR